MCGHLIQHIVAKRFSRCRRANEEHVEPWFWFVSESVSVWQSHSHSLGRKRGAAAGCKLASLHSPLQTNKLRMCLLLYMYIRWWVYNAFAQINTKCAAAGWPYYSLRLNVRITGPRRRAIKRLLCTRAEPRFYFGRSESAGKYARRRRAISDLDEGHLPFERYGQTRKTRCVGARRFLRFVRFTIISLNRLFLFGRWRDAALRFDAPLVTSPLMAMKLFKNCWMNHTSNLFNPYNFEFFCKHFNVLIVINFKWF